MPTMINYGGEMIRISPKDNKKIEYSKNKGLTWILRCTNSSVGVDSLISWMAEMRFSQLHRKVCTTQRIKD